MVDVGIHIRIEPVFVGIGLLPAVQGLALGEADADDRLGAFESVLPWKYDAERGAVLIRELLAVHAETEQGERMHGLVHAETFDVRPLQHAGALARHLFGIVQGGELDKLCFGQGAGPLDQLAQGKSDPGDDDGPALDTAMTVDALFGSSHLDDRVDVEHLLFIDVAVDGYRPGAGLEILCQTGRLVFVGGEFVEIVVVGDILVGRFLFRRAEGAFLEAINLGVGAGGERRSDQIAKITEGHTGNGSRAGDRCAGEEIAPVQIGRFGSNFR